MLWELSRFINSHKSNKTNQESFGAINFQRISHNDPIHLQTIGLVLGGRHPGFYFLNEDESVELVSYFKYDIKVGNTDTNIYFSG